MNKRKAEQSIEEEITEILVCKYCSYETENIDDLDTHILQHVLEGVEGDGEEELEEDEIVLLENDKLKPKKRVRQIQINKKDLYDCPQCSYSTKRKYDLPKHLLTHRSLDTTTVYRCSQCPYETKRKNDMPKHMIAHCTNVEMFKCPDCPYQTKRKSDLPKHLLCHKLPQEVPLYKCDYCDYVTKRKGDLPKHVLNHTDMADLKLWRCTECDYKTRRKNDLTKHMLVHCDRHVAGVFKCLKCTYATDKVHKFSKHALSECKYIHEAIELEHLMLEDILASVGDETVPIVEVTEETEEYYEENYVAQVEEEEAAEEEYVEENQGGMFADQYANYLRKIGVRQNEESKNNTTGVFNINLGEFSMDLEGNASQNITAQDDVQGNDEPIYIKEEESS